ncbi:MAG: pyridoxal phosphate-dependent aminotransferase family protein, partial [bacterium]|nr:pyridoxal phosphate-dependent aminotransferase family protein [bacterium]
MKTNSIKLFINKSLTKIDKDNRRTLKIIGSAQDKYILINGKKTLNLSSNDYLGLANDNRLKDAGIKALREYGTSSSSSRLISGNIKIHEELENALAEYFQTGSCLLFNSGYQANLGVIPALMDKNDEIICDRLCHASIIDGILLSGARFRRFPHFDYDILENILKKLPQKTKKLIITESIFSMNGDIADIPALLELAVKYNCLLYIDEAHSLGILGEKGKGILEKYNIDPENNNIIRLGTLGKAFASFGAFILGNKNLREFLINKSRSFIYSTAIPPSASAISLTSLKIIESEPKRRKDLWDSTFYFIQKLKESGFDTLNTQSPIIPVLLKDNKTTMKFSQRLIEKNIFSPG